MDTYAQIEQDAHPGAHGSNSQKTPTPAQQLAGNYKVGRTRIYGLEICIENPRGTVRSGIDKDGKPWSCLMMAHYGYIARTKGADGDGIDCFVGAFSEFEQIYVINQNDPDSGSFDEHKVMFAFHGKEAAKRAYLSSYERNWKGLGSIVACTVDQFKWWLKHGDTTRPLAANNLPFDGSNDDMEKVSVWDEAANPVGCDFADLMYGLRRDDEEGLLLDSLTAADILEDSEGEMTLDALVTPYNKLERKMTTLQNVMNMAGGDVIQALSMQITSPFKQRGTTNVAVIYELSDGQTVSVYFHNPDTTPNKILPADELVSWKWLLNKKDVTIVVAPERGEDLNIREVARRIVKVAAKNSARFAQANVKRAERLKSIEDLKLSVQAKEAQLNEIQGEIATLTQQVEAKKAEKDAEVTPDVAPEVVSQEDQTAQESTDAKQKSSGPSDIEFVDAAYLFNNATDDFKNWVSEYLSETSYSPFVSAKEMDIAAKNHGASIEWGFYPDGDSDFVGKIIKDGSTVGRIDMGSDGKAMVYTGTEGRERVKTLSGGDYYYSDDDCGEMVDALFRTPLAPAVDPEQTQEAMNKAAEQVPPVDEILGEDKELNDDRDYIQSAIDGKLDFYSKDVTNLLSVLDKKYSDGEMADLMRNAKTALKTFFVAEFQRKVGKV